MAIGGKFNRPAPAAPKSPAKKSRYAGIEAAQPRDPMPTVGLYRFRVLDCVEGVNPGKGTESFKIFIEVVESEGAEALEAGRQATIVFLVTGKGGPSGLARTKSFIMAAAGFEDEDEYNQFDPDGLFIEACTGKVNDFSSLTIKGRLLDCQVSRGNPVREIGRAHV